MNEKHWPLCANAIEAKDPSAASLFLARRRTSKVLRVLAQAEALTQRGITFVAGQSAVYWVRKDEFQRGNVFLFETQA